MNKHLAWGLVVILLLGTGGLSPAAPNKDDSGKKDKPSPSGLDALKDKDPNIRYQAALLLTRLRSEARVAVPALIEALKDDNGRVRMVAAYALWKIDPEQNRLVLPILIAGLHKKDK